MSYFIKTLSIEKQIDFQKESVSIIVQKRLILIFFKFSIVCYVTEGNFESIVQQIDLIQGIYLVAESKIDGKFAICLEEQEELGYSIQVYDSRAQQVELLITIKSLRVDFLDFTLDGKYMCYQDEQGQRFFFTLSGQDQI